MEFKFSTLMNLCSKKGLPRDSISVFVYCLKAFSGVRKKQKHTEGRNPIGDLLRKILSKPSWILHLLGGQIRFPMSAGTGSMQAHNCCYHTWYIVSVYYLASLIGFKKFPSSNINPETGYTDYGFPWFSPVNPGRCWDQRRSVHVNRVSPANTLKNEKCKSPVILPWFSGTPYTGTEPNRTAEPIR
jgi:hypothetical protein